MTALAVYLNLVPKSPRGIEKEIKQKSFKHALAMKSSLLI